MAYVLIAGLELKSIRHSVRFWWHAIPSMNQARIDEGNISADVRTINGVHHTVSVWTDEKAMKNYLASGSLLKAMKVFHRIATGKTLGFSAERAPDWETVHELWVEKGKIVWPHKS